MKVALLTMNAGEGGVVDVVWRLARGLAGRGHSVAVLSDDGPQLAKLREWGIPHEPVRFLGYWKAGLGARRSLRRFFRSFAPDVVHSHSRWPSMVSLLAGRRPEVSTLHIDQLTAHGSIFDRGLVRRSLSVWGRTVVALDASARRMLIETQGLAPERVVVVPNGIDPAGFDPATSERRAEARKKLGLAADEAVAVFVGSMVPWKGADRAVRALAHARGRGIRARLVLCGDGESLPEVKALAESLGVAGDCRFLGWVDPHEAYRAGDFLVLPSRTEGFGLVCVEAMLSGLPVLRTRRGGWQEQIVEGKTGWSVEVDDDEGLQARFVDAASDVERTRACGRDARAHALGNFTERQFVERMDRVYEAAVPRSS